MPPATPFLDRQRRLLLACLWLSAHTAAAQVADAPAAAPTAAEILEQAKRGIGQFDQTFSKERSDKRIHAPAALTKQQRLEKRIEEAYAAAPNKWYQAPKVTEVLDPGTGYDRRRYRVVGAFRTYCITVESNHAPDGLDTMKNGIQQKTTTCEDNELPASEQKW